MKLNLNMNLRLKLLWIKIVPDFSYLSSIILLCLLSLICWFKKIIAKIETSWVFLRCNK